MLRDVSVETALNFVSVHLYNHYINIQLKRVYYRIRNRIYHHNGIVYRYCRYTA
jgi:hypothetical protein